MPQIDDLPKGPRKFKKRRAWKFLEDLSDFKSNETVQKEIPESTQEKNEKLALGAQKKLDGNKQQVKKPEEAFETQLKRDSLKSDTNQKTFGKQLENNQGTIREQPGNNQGTIREQPGNNQGTIREQSGNNQGTIREPSREQLGKNQGTFRTKLESEPISYKEALDLLFRLTGHQREIFIFIASRCCARGTLSTGPVYGKTLEETVSCRLSVIKISFKRLISKRLIERENGKSGRGGFYSFGITEAVKNAALELQKYLKNTELGNNWKTIGESSREQSGNNQGTIREPLGNHPGNNSLSSSSSNLEIKLTTTSDNSLPTEWKIIDLSPLEQIGFSKNHLIQLHQRGKLTCEIVQDSIAGFGFDLRKNDKAAKIDKTPLAYFMGILGKGIPYALPGNYESPQEEAMRLFVKRKKQHSERQNKLDEETCELAFLDWRKGLSSREEEKFLPTDDRGRIKVGAFHEGAREDALRGHFRKEIWPEMRASFGREALNS